MAIPNTAIFTTPTPAPQLPKSLLGISENAQIVALVTGFLGGLVETNTLQWIFSFLKPGVQSATLSDAIKECVRKSLIEQRYGNSALFCLERYQSEFALACVNHPIFFKLKSLILTDLIAPYSEQFYPEEYQASALQELRWATYSGDARLFAPSVDAYLKRYGFKQRTQGLFETLSSLSATTFVSRPHIDLITKAPPEWRNLLLLAAVKHCIANIGVATGATEPLLPIVLATAAAHATDEGRFAPLLAANIAYAEILQGNFAAADTRLAHALSQKKIDKVALAELKIASALSTVLQNKNEAPADASVLTGAAGPTYDDIAASQHWTLPLFCHAFCLNNHGTPFSADQIIGPRAEQFEKVPYPPYFNAPSYLLNRVTKRAMGVDVEAATSSAKKPSGMNNKELELLLDKAANDSLTSRLAAVIHGLWFKNYGIFGNSLTATASNVQRYAAANELKFLEDCASGSLYYPTQPPQVCTAAATFIKTNAQGELWEAKIRALRAISTAALEEATAGESELSVEEKTERITWIVESLTPPSADGSTDWYLKSAPSVTPMLQRLGKRNGWLKPTPIRVDTLGSDSVDKARSSCDLEPLRYVQPERQYYEFGSVRLPSEALPLLHDHPNVFLNSNLNHRLIIAAREIEVRVEDQQEQIQITIVPPPSAPIAATTISGSAMILKVCDGKKLEITQISPQHRKLLGLFPATGVLSFPLSAREEILQIIKGVAKIAVVHADSQNVDQSVPVDKRIVVHLTPLLTGFVVTLSVTPLGSDEQRFPPGSGPQHVATTVAGVMVGTTRDLDHEMALAERIINEANLRQAEHTAQWQWSITEIESALSLLAVLQELGDEIRVVRSSDEGLNLRTTYTSAHLHLRVEKDNQWLALDGEVKSGEEGDAAISLAVLNALRKRSGGRFIEIAGGGFAALSHDLLKRLQLFDQIGKEVNESKKGTLLIPMQASHLLDGAVEGIANLIEDKTWLAHKKKIAKLSSADFAPPVNLAIKLRPYQTEGVCWLLRCAALNAGALLADDMGLGKTVQTLAVLQARGGLGPALVVAPLSVVDVWQREAALFAPDLKLHTFSGLTVDKSNVDSDLLQQRQELLTQLKAGDVLVLSYGLLGQESTAELLCHVQFATAVLDEAQAIKNPLTNRARAAFHINSQFRIALSGTPIENRLLELWSIFQYLNPGLLLGAKDFHRRFAYPIEKEGHQETYALLKEIVAPYLLRRRKGDVLKELPPRVELTLVATPEKDEADLYRALQVELIKEVEKSAEGEDTGLRAKSNKKLDLFSVLTAITKLRRAACHPQLAKIPWQKPSAKMELCAEKLDEVLANGHKVLVFSQFVDHLKLFGEVLVQRGIGYFYLDGQTPARARKDSVERFQAGENDVFLISLKAGGTGLTLTAADYVFHLDPWWNPAVEDQASDRAHRMGQKRTVTVCRFVTAGTIEEKILKLHEEKRDLADTLLADADFASNVAVEDLLNLMRGGVVSLHG